MKKLILYTAFLIIISCKSYKLKSDNSTLAIKFMGTVKMYPMDLNEKIFWENPDEHAFIKIEYEFKESYIDSLPKMREDKHFEFLKYAFIYKNGNKNDTIYADQSLKAFYKIEKGKDRGLYKYNFYYDYKDKFDMLKITYSFFNDCW
jgi:hypothetical protein